MNVAYPQTDAGPNEVEPARTEAEGALNFLKSGVEREWEVARHPLTLDEQILQTPAIAEAYASACQKTPVFSKNLLPNF